VLASATAITKGASTITSFKFIAKSHLEKLQLAEWVTAKEEHLASPD